ncbi:hypothetical protein [Streptomyces sp. NBC_01217]|uniref:hypothetical protein n=1 Tax=Streptomyces sp. NBC_01217 TaxID=2903779 RepID=UPI002E10F35D|nr:hypothetical protein OG507_14095 [Streptomyces sp. NBC_01217]
MAVGAEHVVGLARRILSEALDEREAGAENASDWSRIFDQEEADTVVRLLAIMASIESDGRVREAQLHAILEISDSLAVGTDLLHPLQRLTPEILDAEQLGYLDELGIQLEG